MSFIGVKTTGIEEVIAKLRNIAVKVPDHARRTMHKGADKIVVEAALNSPVDLHNLESSINKVVTYADTRRLQIDITVGGMVDGVDVDEYAVRVHENYEHMGVGGGPTKPGRGTLAKRAANPGRYIGSKFLERAVEAEREKLAKMMIAAIEEDLR